MLRQRVEIAAVLGPGNGDELADRPFDQWPDGGKDRVTRVGVEDPVEAHVETDHGR